MFMLSRSNRSTKRPHFQYTPMKSVFLSVAFFFPILAVSPSIADGASNITYHGNELGYEELDAHRYFIHGLENHSSSDSSLPFAQVRRRMEVSTCPLHYEGDKCKKDFQCCSFSCISKQCQGSEVPCGFQRTPCGVAFSECKKNKDCCSQRCVEVKLEGKKQGFCAGFVPAERDPGEFQTEYGGLVWDLWRIGWKDEDGKLATQPYSRSGFKYGHKRRGRDSRAVTGNGDKGWGDYEFSFDYKMLPRSSEWNPYGIAPDTRRLQVMFRIKSMTESWNKPKTSYQLSIRPDGSWFLEAFEDSYFDGRGCCKLMGKLEILAEGNTKKDMITGRLRLRVVGSSITAWLNEKELFTHVHDSGAIDPILYGGFGVGFIWESMGWISNLDVKHILQPCTLRKAGGKCKKDFECCSFTCEKKRCQGDTVPRRGFQPTPCVEAFSECKKSNDCCSQKCVIVKTGEKKQGFCAGSVAEGEQCQHPTAAPTPNLGDFQAYFGGLVWDLWRIGWKVENGKLATQPNARPGFSYGHSSNGRDSLAITGNGDEGWRDYEVAFDYEMLPRKSIFNPYGISEGTRRLYVWFRIKSMTESWNLPDTNYKLLLQPTGWWVLEAFEDFHFANVGCCARVGKTVELAEGVTDQATIQGRLRLRVVGTSITAWLNDEQLFSYVHDSQEIAPILYGGFGVGFLFESMGWISNLETEHIDDSSTMSPSSAVPTMSPRCELPTAAPASLGEFQTNFGCKVWDLWRTGWKVKDGKLATQPYSRPGFDYGHSGNGRDGEAITGNGDESWRDYEVSFDYYMQHASPEWNPYHISGETRGLKVMFRIKSMTESWNQPKTNYQLSIRPTGNWFVEAFEDFHFANRGCCNRVGKLEILTQGNIDQSTMSIIKGRLRLRVEGSSMSAWLNDKHLFTYVHESGAIDPILYGGFGVGFIFESMRWISNLEVEHINDSSTMPPSSEQPTSPVD